MAQKVTIVWDWDGGYREYDELLGDTEGDGFTMTRRDWQRYCKAREVFKAAENQVARIDPLAQKRTGFSV